MKDVQYSKRTIVFREILYLGEIVEMIKLSKNVYSNDQGGKYNKIPDNRDRGAVLFGLFEVASPDCTRLVGCLRLVGGRLEDSSACEFDRVALKDEYKDFGLDEFIGDCVNAWVSNKHGSVMFDSDAVKTYSDFFRTFGCVRKDFGVNLVKECSSSNESQTVDVREAA